MTDRIAQIIELEKEAEADLGRASDRNWQAAELISLELRDGKSLRTLGKEIGKTHVHVLYMRRAWELVGQYHEDGSRPDFYKTYNSAEVRGDVDPHPAVSTPSTKQATREEEDTTEADDAHTWVAAADDAIRNLQNFGESLRFLSAVEREILAGLPDRVYLVLRDLERRTGSQRAS